MGCWKKLGEIEPTSREELNPAEEYFNFRDRATKVCEQIESGRSKSVDLYRGRINFLEEEEERKE